MTNYYQNLTKEAKKELINSLERKLRNTQYQIDWYRRAMDECDPDNWQRATYLDMIDYHCNEKSKILEVLRLVKSED